MDAEQRRQLSEKVGEAVDAAISPMGMPGMLGDFIVIGAVVNVGEDGLPLANYFVLFSGGYMLPHTALGLLSKGEDLLLGGMASESEDDG